MSVQEESKVSEPRWLTTDQLAAWRGFMRLLQRLPAALESQLQQDSKLSFFEYYVLAHLSDQPERRMRMSELALLANTELSRLSHMMGRLEKRGFVRREPDPHNGRYTQAILTEAGYAHLADAAPGHVARVQDLFVDVLTPDDLRTLQRISDKVLARIEHSQGRTTSDRPADRAPKGAARFGGR
ncbi:MarR family winged helix-turn-helix transcriptional regulator [Actinoallomurus soli]|uniref:MarR family winged helix-turn-helix transcriptional regulator n=1 Tax=Actinoallomurus soli TaxID=2952535 RepID=UPI0020927F65|nr:MarR family transcriptional regulator [Actinoallomurus soli]MCO5973577.1 MarR family transcriptional regulator [Actinoallomurus soli]